MPSQIVIVVKNVKKLALTVRLKNVMAKAVQIARAIPAVNVARSKKAIIERPVLIHAPVFLCFLQSL